MTGEGPMPRAVRLWPVLAGAHAALLMIALSLPHAARAEEAIVVARGDTLSAIAVRHGTTAAALAAANGLISPDRVLAGQRLIVPSGASRLAGYGAGGAGPGHAWHVVAPGETLYALAVRTGTTIDALVVANDLATRTLLVGQRLLLPVAPVKPPAAASIASVVPGGPRRIVVDLSLQTLTAYQGEVAVRTFVVSTGTGWTPTPTGTWPIYARLALQDMVGPGYALDDVPYVQYFTGAYAIHGAYWHNEFGRPVTHGCVNLLPWDAKWLWDWASMGTPVVIAP